MDAMVSSSVTELNGGCKNWKRRREMREVLIVDGRFADKLVGKC